MTEKKDNSETSVEDNLSQEYIPQKKHDGIPMQNPQVANPEAKKKLEETQKQVEKFKKEITKKFKFIEAVGILPEQTNKKIEEEYEISEEDSKKGLLHILTVIPEEHYKEIGKIRLEAINLAKSINEKLWIHLLTPVDLWNLCLDSKFDIFEFFSMSYPIFDKGILGAIRVSSIHKSLVLKKFEKYVTSYIIGGSLVRGEATETSDVDVAVIIDDTDVKRMPRLELREKLRSIIAGQHWQEATALADVKNILNVQVWLLTDFWERVKDAEPVAFTFLRDGVPLYDRGTFTPWKTLLKMGKIKPSPEAIDMFMAAGDKLEDTVNRRMLDILMMDIYWGVMHPTQGLLMLYGLSPGNLRETVKDIKEIFVEKEKLLEKKYADIFEEIMIKYYKGYEHGKVKKISGSDLERIFKNATDYIKRLKELRKQIEKRIQEKSIQQIYKDTFGMLESMLKKKSETAIIKEFEEKLIKTGRFPQKFLENLKFIAKTKKEFEKTKTKKKKSSKKDKKEISKTKEVDKARKLSQEIINALIEYNQRCDFLSMDRTRFIIKSKESEQKAEIFFLDKLYIVNQNKIQKLENGKLKNATTEELREKLSNHKSNETKIDLNELEELKKVFGNFEMIY